MTKKTFLSHIRLTLKNYKSAVFRARASSQKKKRRGWRSPIVRAC